MSFCMNSRHGSQFASWRTCAQNNPSSFFNVLCVFFNVCLFLRERKRQSLSGGWGGEREGDTETEAGFRL